MNIYLFYKKISVGYSSNTQNETNKTFRNISTYFIGFDIIYK